jgi:hypothetical protein
MELNNDGVAVNPSVYLYRRGNRQNCRITCWTRKTMDNLFQKTLTALKAAFDVLEKHVERPIKVPYKDSFRFRYEQKSIQQALIQKLARTVSGLHAARILLLNGFVQEQGALQRMLDEFQEDICFLSYGLIEGTITELHQRYLSDFYQEEFEDLGNPEFQPHSRGMIPRKKIRAYIAKMEGMPLDPNRGIQLTKSLSKAYSGYVHGASPHIMEMYGGVLPMFHINGMLGTSRFDEHKDDLWNYFYRGILSFILVSLSFDNQELTRELFRYRDWFEKQSGTNFGGREE